MRRRVILVLRLLLGAIFLYAAYTKLRESYLIFAMSIDSYQILPPDAVLGVARTLPWVELAVGIWLLAGWRIAPAATAATLILAVFFGVMVFTYGKGLQIDCGCFGLGEALTWKTLVRDGSLVAAAGALAVLAWGPRNP
ncbi:MAG TPA: MauE/DoxX family redox-associated membrane protein [Bryobacteraceae bacterium]|jgi:uncharacterized membrane protein YphA (DoxX/SURF4 family)